MTECWQQAVYNLPHAIEDRKTVESLASNHVVIDLEPSFRKTVKILKLNGKTRLENLLELIKSKIGTELYNKAMKTFVAPV